MTFIEEFAEQGVQSDALQVPVISALLPFMWHCVIPRSLPHATQVGGDWALHLDGVCLIATRGLTKREE